jgi:hypothetical protein
MEYTVFGYKINLMNTIICMILGFLIATHTGYSCCKISVKEAMTNIAHAATIDHSNMVTANTSSTPTVVDKTQTYKGTPVPLENTLLYFKDNEFKPECCPSTYSSSRGCACTSGEQRKYINERGGNRTLPSEF